MSGELSFIKVEKGNNWCVKVWVLKILDLKIYCAFSFYTERKTTAYVHTFGCYIYQRCNDFIHEIVSEHSIFISAHTMIDFNQKYNCNMIVECDVKQ